MSIEQRDYTSAPGALTVESVRAWLTEKGAGEIIKRRTLAQILGVSERTIANAERKGEFSTVDRATYRLTDCLPWIMKTPRFIAQQGYHWKITEETAAHIRVIINKEWRGLLRYSDLDDLTQETIVRMMRQPSSECPEWLVIRRILARIWREYKNKGITATINIEESRFKNRIY